MFHAYLKSHALMLHGVLTFHMLSVKVGLVKNVPSVLNFILKNSFRLSNISTSEVTYMLVHRLPGSYKTVTDSA